MGRLALDARYRAETASVALLSGLARLAPPGVRHAVGTGLGSLTWAVDARHRRVARDNVRLAYGDTLSPAEARRIVLGSMRHFARLLVETLAFERYLKDDVHSRVRVEGVEHLRNALARGKGVIGFTGHLGHWELMSFMFGRLGLPATGIARPLDNPYLERRLVRLRALSGNRIVNKHGAFRAGLEVLQQGGFLGIWIDQRPKSGGILVPFFGRDAYTTDGLARFALASEAAVVPCFMVREADGWFRMAIEPEVPPVRSGSAEADSVRITAACTAILERWVRQYPDQWLWTHRRWAIPKGAGSGEPGRSDHGA